MKPNGDQTKNSGSKPGTKPDATDDLKSLPLPEVEKKLGSSPDGLSRAEAQKRLAQYGPNEIEEKKTNPLLKFLTYFWGPIPWMIEVAVILSALVRHWPDFFIILVLLLANAIVGFWEEYQAGNAIAAFKASLRVRLPPVLAALLFAVTVWILHRELWAIRCRDVRDALAVLPTSHMLLALLFTAANYLVLTNYDHLANEKKLKKFWQGRI